MHLVFPAPVGTRPGPIAIADDLVLEVRPAVPLSSSFDAWTARVLREVTVSSRERGETRHGWTLTLVRATEPARLHAFYELFDHGVHVIVGAPDDAALDRALPQVTALLRAGDLDRRQREVVALAQLWEET